MESDSNKMSGKRWVWGTAIIYVLFACGTVGIVFFASRQKEELVSEDYYKREVAYQQKIEDIKRTNALKESISWKLSDDRKTMEFHFLPHTATTGSILFYRPSESSMDKKIAIAPDANGVQQVNIDGLAKGLWKIKVEYTENNLRYYKEADVTL